MDIGVVCAKYNIYYPPVHPMILTPDMMQDKWSLFQYDLRLVAQFNQNGKCICAERLDGVTELHHALVTRADVTKNGNRDLIHHSYNVILVHKECHHNLIRENCFKYLSHIYGHQELIKWYKSLPFEHLRKVEYLL